MTQPNSPKVLNEVDQLTAAALAADFHIQQSLQLLNRVEPSEDGIDPGVRKDYLAMRQFAESAADRSRKKLIDLRAKPKWRPSFVDLVTDDLSRIHLGVTGLQTNLTLVIHGTTGITPCTGSATLAGSGNTASNRSDPYLAADESQEDGLDSPQITVSPP